MTVILASLSEKDKEMYVDFTFMFSRLEFLLKESRYIKPVPRGCDKGWILIDWDCFITDYSAEIEIHESWQKLIVLSPKKQFVQPDGHFIWRPNYESKEKGACFKEVISHVKTVRNNLFHGGKETLDGFELKGRDRELIMAGCEVLMHLHQFLKRSDKFQKKLRSYR